MEFIWKSSLFLVFLVFVSSPIALEKPQEKIEIPVKRCDFRTTLRYTLKREGFYAFVKNDYGLETYAGISRRYHPNFRGWYIIDEYKKHHQIKWNDSIPGVQWYVNLHYLDIFIDEGFFDIKDQNIANQIFDFRINSNFNAYLITNRVLSEMGYKVSIIGELTPETIKALNSCNSWEFLAHFTSSRATFYSNLVIKNNSQLEFLSNWMSRTKIN